MSSLAAKRLLALAAPVVLALAALAQVRPAPVCPICGGDFEEFVDRFERVVDVSARILVHALLR